MRPGQNCTRNGRNIVTATWSTGTPWKFHGRAFPSKEYFNSVLTCYLTTIWYRSQIALLRRLAEDSARGRGEVGSAEASARNHQKTPGRGASEPTRPSLLPRPSKRGDVPVARARSGPRQAKHEPNLGSARRAACLHRKPSRGASALVAPPL